MAQLFHISRSFLSWTCLGPDYLMLNSSLYGTRKSTGNGAGETEGGNKNFEFVTPRPLFESLLEHL
jgi:hypothetical protein